MRELLCTLPDYGITMDRFSAEYSKLYGKMNGYYGYPRLSSLLESFTDSVEVRKLS